MAPIEILRALQALRHNKKGRVVSDSNRDILQKAQYGNLVIRIRVGIFKLCRES
ncbi:hypothetical protein [Helicobacter marmotae]|uniref:hypothetical protein n=1 Tax=Helicobacter marmotae TaxID=152490 RepID=UPI001475E17D|nr:hypothetical protein [Helicobacter marmotae]